MIKRTRYVVDRSFQQRVAQELMVIVLLVPIVLWANFFLLGQYALTQNPHIDELPRDWGLAGLLFQQQWWMILLFIVFSVGLTFVFVLYYTHRIAGPVYRFTRALDDISDGKLGGAVKLRDGDCFESLGTSLSRASGRLADTMKELRDSAGALGQRADTLGDAELRAHVDALNRILDRYTVVQPPP